MILATILCGRCAAENRRAEKLGTVEKDDDDRLYWAALDPKEARRQTRGLGPDVRYWHAWVALDSASEDLPACCKRHGYGRVALDDVRRRRGTFTVEIKAAPMGQTGSESG